jgi:gliding motility-associated-like protein
MKKIFTLFILLLSPILLLAQPANNNCTGAQIVLDNGSCVNGTTVGANDSWTGLVGCQGGNQNADHEDVWYQFTATNSSFSSTITAGAGWGGDLEFTLWSPDPVLGCAGLFTLVSSSCGASPLTATATGLVPGNTYYMVVSTTANGTTGAFSICTQTTAPPVNCTDNDACADAATITLNAAGAGAACINDCNTGANPGIDFTGNNCEDLPNPTVWYTFTTGPNTSSINVSLNSAQLSDPEFVIFVGNSCVTWTTLSCVEGTGGSASANNIAVQSNQIYTIAVSDVTADQGTFDLCITQNPDNSACNTNNSLQVTSTSLGSPLTGPFQPGEQVTFCYTVTDYQQINCNYIGAFVPTFGDCWAASSFNAQGMPVIVNTPLNVNGVLQPCGPGPPCAWSACVGTPAGSWNWFPAGSVTYNVNGAFPAGTAMPGGWYFLSSYNPATGACTGGPTDPDNTYGDGNFPNCGVNTFDYTICFTLTAGPSGNCGTGQTDCSVSMRTFADGEFGAWNNIGCTQDQPNVLPNNLLCCVPPTLSTLPTNVSCFGGNNGAIDLSLVGGQAPYTYLWSNGQTTQDLTGLTAGIYSVTVTENFGCLTVTSVTITQPATLTSSATVTNVSCNGGNNGSINLTAAGGTGTLTYNWGGGITTEDRTGLTAGVYTVTVTDANSCTTVTSATITQPSILTVSTTQVNVSCFGGNNGSINLTAAGGTAPYTYNWGGGVTSEDRTGLTAGVYTVTVTDFNSCSTVTSATITEPAILTASTSQVNVSCGGANNGSINLTAGGGTGVLTYNWGGGITTEDRTGLTAGVYTVTVTDANSCTTVTSATITEPTVLTASTTQVNVSCNGGINGSINLTAAGGTGTLTYNWGGGITTEDRTGLTAGVYTVTVTDANSCTTVTSATITQPSILTVTRTQVNVSCFGGNNGSINLTAAGGTAPYTYNWGGGVTSEDRTGLTAGVYTVTVTDFNSCSTVTSATITEPVILTASTSQVNVSCGGANNGSINLTAGGGTGVLTYNWGGGITTEDRTGLTAGVYTVTVTDANSCTTVTSATITEPTVLTASTTQVNISCFGGNNGSINLTAAGGTGTLTYNWGGGITTEDRTGLTAGVYTVTVTDANSCTTVTSATITQPSILTVTRTQVNVSCFGGNNGSINLTAAGGTAPYTYNWGGGVTSEDRTGLTAGVYTVTVTDFNSCSTVTSATITEPAILNTSVTVTDALCGTPNGAVDLSVTGGISPYTYSWNTGATTQDISGLTNGSFTVTVTDNNSCTTITTATVNQTSAATITFNSTNVSCNGGNNGAIDITANGGVLPYTFSWSNGAITEDVSALNAGVYTVTVTDATLCFSTAVITITEPAAISVNGIITNVNCNGGNNGAIDVTASGGTGAFSFSWDGSVFIEDRTGLTAGVYNLTVTDVNNCTATYSATVTEPIAPLSVSNAFTDVLCFGDLTGAVDLTVLGGTSPYNFNWSNGAITEDINNLGAAVYTVTVTDFNNCTTVTSATITQPSAAISISSPVINPACGGFPTGQIDLTVNGGTPNYDFEWSNGATTEDVGGLLGGIYTVTITDANNCILISSATITEPPAISASNTFINITCFGADNGSINVTVTGGTPGFNYIWSNSSTTEDISGLAPGTYTVSVTDANNCLAVTAATISEPAILTSSATQINVSCFGGNNGSINLTVGGGTTPYSFNWGGGIVSEDRTGLTAGTYTVTVSDANSCTTVTSVTLTQPAAIAVSTSQQNVLCNAGNNGAIDLTVGGATAPYSFIWSNGRTTEDLTGLTAGTYQVTVTDANFCTTITSATVTEPSAITLTTVVTNSSCFGSDNGSVDLTVSGGTPGYSFSWSNAAISEDINSLSPNTYTVTITDGNSCTATRSVTVTEPVLLTASTTQVNVSCFGGNNGSINLTVGGGTTPYSFNWGGGIVSEDRTGLTAGTYTVTVTDANFCTTVTAVTITQPTILTSSATQVNVSCFGGNNGSIDLTVGGGTAPYSFNWGAGIVSEDRTNLTAGTYTVTVTDGNSCTTVTSVTITQPTAITATTVSGNVSCFNGNNGFINLTVSGGTVPYSFNWGAGITSEDRTGLTAGTYTVTVTDGNGCTLTRSATITQPSVLGATTTQVNVSCFGGNNGAVNLTVTGGTTPYSYNWTGGVNTEDRTGLSAGTYSVTVTDANFCTTVTAVTITQPAQLSASNTFTNISCFGGTNGSVNLTVTGGTQPYAFNWSNGRTTEDINTLSAGTYTVTVTDLNGCSITSTAVITQPAQLSASTTQVNVQCNGTSTGSINLTVAGGTLPYAFNWGGGVTTEDRTGLSAGTYNVVITDANGCSISTSAIISQPAATIVTFTRTDVSCFGGNNGSATASVSGGVAPYLLSWSNGANTASINNLSAGTYTLTVTDANGCQTVRGVTVQQPATAVTANILSVTNNLCFGGTTGAIDADALGGTPNYTFLWSTGATTQDISGLTAGSYSLTATDAVGCTATASTVISQPTQLNANTSLVSNFNGAAISCPGAADGAITSSASGGVAPYSFVWSTNQNTPSLSGLTAGTYTLTVTDANGCSVIRSITLNDPVQLQANEQHVDVFCHGDCDGQIIVTAVAGTGTLGLGGYEYRILGPGQVGNVFSNINNFTALCAGNYVVEVRDGNGCQIALPITINQPTAITISASTNPVICNGTATGSATATASGGIAPYSFVWSNGATGATANGLAAGGYTVTVTDANGCILTTNVVITQPTVLSASTSFTEPSCFASTNGSATVTPTGGVLPYSFAWSNGSASATALGLPAGQHSVTVTDAGGCAIVRSVTVTQPSQLVLTTSGTNLTCAGNGTGSATVSIAGGTAPFNILWSNGATTATVTGLGLGIFSVVVTDVNGCQQSTQIALTQPNPIVASLVSSTNVSCFGGSNGTATITANGGVTPYSFSWPNGQTTATGTGLAAGTYTATVTDANGCSNTVSMQITEPALLTVVNIASTSVSCRGGNNGTASAFIQGGSSPYSFTWSNGGAGQSISNLTAGTYFLTVTDGNGCRAFSQGIVTEPASNLVGFINTTPALCLGAATGEMAAIISGGTVPTSGDYSYVWSNGASSAVVSNVSAGNYSVTVTDANGCTLSLAATVGQAGNLNLSVVGTTPANCPGASNGTATVTANGGTGTLNFQWSNGQNTPSATGLSAGVYTVTVTDVNGCSQNTSVTVTEGAPVNLVTAVTDVRCFGESNGRLDVTSSGISLYFWSTGQVGNPLANIPAGQYTLTVVDDRGCETTAVYNVGQPNELQANISVLNPVLCHNEASANVLAAASGGTAAYSYIWSNGVNGAANSSLPSGNYTLTVTDANGCRTVETVSLSNPSALELSVSTVDVRCTGDQNGRIIVSANGGTINFGAYEFSIDSVNWQTGDLFPGLGVDTFTVYVRDANGCVTEQNAVIEAAEPFFITAFSPMDTTIEYGDTLILSVMLNDTADAQISWIDVNNGNSVFNSSDYEVSVTPANLIVYRFEAQSPLGCRVDTTVIVSVTKPRRAAAPAAFTPNGDGTNDSFFVQGDEKVSNVKIFRIYDRWGELVFEAENIAPNDPTKGWDGTFKGQLMNSGVYAWYAEVEYIDGFADIIRGDLTLLR